MSWQLASWTLMLAALAMGFVWFERSRPSSKLIAMVATLAAAAVAGRLLLAPIPNVKPTTDIVLFSGYVLGGAPGFAVGALAALASNVFLGQGPWTPWQMLGWGLVGVGGAALARASGRKAGRKIGRWPLAVACAVASLGFGALMDFYQWLTFSGTDSVRGYLAVSAASLWFNVAHAAGSLIFALALGPLVLRALDRYAKRVQVHWTPAASPEAPGLRAASRGTIAGLLACALVAGPAVHAARAAGERGPPPPGAVAAKQDWLGAAVKYLRHAQNGDGGFGGDADQSSNQLFTGWAALGLEAAGVNPLSVKRDGKSVIDYVKEHAAAIDDTGELERTVLLARGAGLDPRRFAGRNLVTSLVSRQRGDGSFDRQTGLTAFGILALRASGKGQRSAPIGRALKWLATRQRGDGGFAASTGSKGGDVDITGAVLQALAAAGRGRSERTGRAVSFLERKQNPDGGFGQGAGASSSNAQSTAWVLQGFAAAGKRSPKASREAAGYLEGLQRLGGSFAYSRDAVQTPVWVTAQVIPALAGRAFPLAPVAAHRSVAAGIASADTGASRGASGSGSERGSDSSGEGAAPRQDADSGGTVSPVVKNLDPTAQSIDQNAAKHDDSGVKVAYLVATGLIVAGLATIAVAVRRRRLP